MSKIKRIFVVLALFFAPIAFAGPIAVSALKPNAPFSPSQLANNAAWYSLAGSASDSTYLLNGSNVALIADRSGNSATNGLVLNGANGNSTTTPDTPAISITGDIDIRAQWALASYSPTTPQVLVAKWLSGGAYSYQLYLRTDGKLEANFSLNGSTATTVTSTSAVGFSAFSTNYLRATRVASTGVATLYTSQDGTTWNQIGQATLTSGNIADTSAVLQVGANNDGGTNINVSNGICYYADVRNTVANDGTGIAFKAVFSGVAKLAASFKESSSNAATVTINTSGDFGARISGARDLVQLTAAKQPAFSSTNGNHLTTDGVNDYMRSASFSLAQPISEYTVASMVAWTSGAYMWDGASGANSAAVIMTTGTPQLNINAGSSVAANTNAVVGTPAVFTEFLSGASSYFQVNATTATTGSAGTASPNGVTIGASGASTAASFSNITLSEKLIRAASDSTTTNTRIYNYERLKWAVVP